MRRERDKILSGYLRAKSLEPTDADSSACSVGDCNVTNSSYAESPYHLSSLKVQEGHCIEIEYFCDLGCKELCFSHNKAELAGKIH